MSEDVKEQVGTPPIFSF